MSRFDLERAKTVIESGRVLVVPNFISHTMVNDLREDVEVLAKAGSFKPSGLSNR